MTTLLAVSLDLDELSSYHEIHGLEESPSAASRAVWTVAVPRALDFLRRLEVPATFFVVGQSLDAEIGAPTLERIVEDGHEVANHTFSHFYDLLRRGPAQRRDEITRAAEAIEAVTGARPRGFRAPGYNVDDELIALLEELGYSYDSSVFPCPLYYAAKAAALAAIRARGRRSRSLLGPQECLLAPTEPYRPGRSFWRPKRRGLLGRRVPHRGLLELPVATLPGVRSPFIGTALALAGPRASMVMAHAVAARRFVGLELHGVDFLDGDDADLEDLVEHQHDLKVPLERKLASYEAAISALRARGAQTVTSLEAARRLQASRRP